MRTTYYFCIFKCQSNDCPFHQPICDDPIEMFGDPVPYQDADNNEHYCLGEDPEEKYMNAAQQKTWAAIPNNSPDSTECWDYSLLHGVL